MLFHEYLKNLRMVREMGLRELAHKIGWDVGNYSKIERGLLSPPQKEEFIEQLASALKLSADERQKLSDMSALSSGKIPADIADDMKRYEFLPVLMRTIANKQLTDEQLKELTERVNKKS